MRTARPHCGSELGPSSRHRSAGQGRITALEPVQRTFGDALRLDSRVPAHRSGERAFNLRLPLSELGRPTRVVGDLCQGPDLAPARSSPITCDDVLMQVTARVDYAVRALLELAAHPDGRMTRSELADAQSIPPRYLEAVLSELRTSGLVVGRRGQSGGYRLGRPAAEISVAEISRAVDGPLALVQGQRPEHVSYSGSSEHLHELWICLRAAVRSVLESVTLADLLSGELPPLVRSMVDDPDAWLPR